MVDKALQNMPRHPTQTVQTAMEAWHELADRAERLANENDSANSTIALLTERIHWLEKELSDSKYAGDHYRRVNQEISSQLQSIAILFNEAIQRVKDGNYSRPQEIVSPLPTEPFNDTSRQTQETNLQTEEPKKPQGKGVLPEGDAIPAFLTQPKPLKEPPR